MYKIIIALFIVLGVTGFGYYYFNKNNINLSPSKTDTKEEVINFPQLEKSEDLGFFVQNQTTYEGVNFDDKKIKTISNYKYYGYGEVPSGKYLGYKVYLVESNINTATRYSFNQEYARKDENEVYKVQIIAVKDGKFLSYDEFVSQDEYGEDFLKTLSDKKKYLGQDVFPLPFKETYQINSLNKLSKSLSEPVLFQSIKNPKVKIKKLDFKVDGYDSYEASYSDEQNKVTNSANFVNFNGLAIFYESLLGNIKDNTGKVSSQDFGLTNSKYKNYSLLKYPCTIFGSLDLKGYSPEIVSPVNLEKVSSNSDINLYRIKNLNSKINEELIKDISQNYYYIEYDKLKLDYDTKVNIKEIENDGLLIYQDVFGNYRGIIQADSIDVRGGCGKPVVYLYPDKDTKVTLKFQNPMYFTTVIPNYSDSWEVLAKPNGVLKDLKPELTNCNLLGNKNGSEYAKEACEKNEYPYLYWSGNTKSQYPGVDSGFIVKKENLNTFFDEKLSSMNFNQKEINDFKEYWVSYLNKKDEDYFRISFFQTNQVNALFPMNVTPKPNSSIRIFMDWDYATAETKITEQKLISTPRKGFTLVEWGGLKK